MFRATIILLALALLAGFALARFYDDPVPVQNTPELLAADILSEARQTVKITPGQDNICLNGNDYSGCCSKNSGVLNVL